MAPIIQAQFIVSIPKEYDPDLMCSEIGVKPHKVWRVGEEIGTTIRTEDTNGWLIATEKMETYDVDDALRKLLNIIGEVFEKIIRLAANYAVEIEFSVSADIREEMPSINLSQDILSEICKFNATLDIDLN